MTLKPKKKLHVRLQAMLLSLIMIISFVPFSVFAADDPQDQTANDDIVRALSLSYKLKGQEGYVDFTEPYKIDDITKVDSFKAKYTFSLEDNVAQDGQPNRTVTEGDYYLIDLPEDLIITSPAGGSIDGNDGKAIANYSFIKEEPGNWQVKVEFTDYVDDKSEYEIEGGLEFEFVLDHSAIGEGSSKTIYIPIDSDNRIEIEISKPEPPETMPVSLTKSVKNYDQVSRQLVWNVKMEPEDGIFSGCVFTDTIDVERLELILIKHGSVTLTQGTDYTYNSATGEISYTIPSGRDGKNFQNIEITTSVKPSVYGKLGSTIINNQAYLKEGENDVNIESNSASYTITPDWFKKSGSRIDGNRIKWTLTANTTRQNMYNAIITDYFQADVKLDTTTLKLGSTSIDLKDDSYIPANDQEIYAVYTVNANNTSELKIYLPRGAANASNGTQIITFETDVVPRVLTNEDPVYTNDAKLEADYIGDGGEGGTIPAVNIEGVGVAVPHVSIVKGNKVLTADDKRNGTIVWTINAVSNLSDYGKSTIVDTLPENQTYVADEIYWGSTKINEEGNPSVPSAPSAVISGEGRILTITFTDHEALKTMQTFTVKTKIDPDIYGDNLSGQSFTNKAEAFLYDKGGVNVLDEDEDTHSVSITNSVINKTAKRYNGNVTKQGINPQVDYTITINSNLMPLKNVSVTDDLDNIITQFRKNGESGFTSIDNVKWTYVEGSLEITNATPGADRLDSFNLETIKNATEAAYNTNDNLIKVDFGKDTQVNDKYIITFTVELDIFQDDIFKENGTIRTRGNISGIEGDGLKSGIISTPGTGNVDFENKVLEKSGVMKSDEEQIEWTIRLNQHRVQLDNTRVEDVLPLGLTLDPTSIKLYTDVIGTNGNFIPDSELDTKATLVDEFTYIYREAGEGNEGRYELIVDLPENERDYILRFATDVDRSLIGKTISNNAYYVGETGGQDNSDSESVEVTGSSGGSSTRKSSLTIQKRSGDNEAVLDGASFDLHWLKNGTEPVFVRSGTIAEGSGGTLTFYGLSKGEKYTITETGAPAGYIIDNESPVELTIPPHGEGDLDNLTVYNTPVKSGSWQPAAIKKLVGKEIETDRPFKFEISDGNKAVMTGITNSTPLANGDYSVNFTLKDGVTADDVLNFNNSYIFDKDDSAGKEVLISESVRTFYLKEIPVADPGKGYEFDTKEYEFVVKAYNVKGQENLKVVIEDGEGNVLSDNTGRFTEVNTPVFRNTYQARGEFTPSAEKILLGNVLKAGQFSFELYEGDILLETVTNEEGVLTGGNDYKADVRFSTINYTESDIGTKTYRIVEKNVGLESYDYDSAQYTITVNVEDDDQGNLTSSIEEISKLVDDEITVEEKVSFSNIYTLTEIEFAAEKTLTGRQLSQDQFEFSLTLKGDGSDTIIEKVKNSEDGKIEFSPIIYNAKEDAGKTYTYEVKEINDNKAGYEYDNTVYKVIVSVIDEGDGTISTESYVVKAGEENTHLDMDSIIFSNIYEAQGSITFNATKDLTGRELADKQFTFVLADKDGEKLQEVKNDADGNITFADVIFNQDEIGQHEYTIYEVNDGNPGYTYDNTIYHIILNVGDNGDGTLSTDAYLLGTDEETIELTTESMIFSNIYEAQGSIVFNGKKDLTGRGLADKEFTFVLADIDGEIIQEVKNDADGKIVFDEIFFNQDQLGIYNYKIYEIAGDGEDINYDNAIYHIRLEVKDNGDGTLDVIASIEKEINGEKADTDNIIFVNEYDDPSLLSGVGTGDKSPLSLYLTIAISSLLIICFLFITRYRLASKS